jgi:ubiquinone/menaquinone biosynthesis C-methylase UbiE
LRNTDATGAEVFGGALYGDDAAEATEASVAASLGCGVPTAVADLHNGETVLDLGSGAGADVLISARRVGPTGKAIGVDMTDEMLVLARANATEAGVENVEFIKGYLEELPIPDASVDVVISNCVINLAADKATVLREAARVLRPGGRFAISDVVVRGAVPDNIRKSVELWIGCVAGALEEQEFISLLAEAGFENPSIEATRVYETKDAAAFLAGTGIDVAAVAPLIDGKFISAFVRGTKPSGAGAPRALPTAKESCCGPDCGCSKT